MYFFMPSVRLATSIPGTNRYLVVTSFFNNGEPLHLRVSIFTTQLEGWYWEYRMVGPFTSVYSCEEYLPIQTTFAIHRTRSSRAHWGKNDRSVARSARYFFGRVPAIGTCRRRHCVVHFMWQLINHPVAVSLWDRFSLATGTNAALLSLQYFSHLFPTMNRIRSCSWSLQLHSRGQEGGIFEFYKSENRGKGRWYIPGRATVSKFRSTLPTYLVDTTDSVRGVTIGEGQGATKSAARCSAATQALGYLYARGIFPTTEDSNWQLMYHISM